MYDQVPQAADLKKEMLADFGDWAEYLVLNMKQYVGEDVHFGVQPNVL